MILMLPSLFIKWQQQTLKCIPYILISQFTWLLQWFIILDMKHLVNVSHHYWMLLKLSIKLKSTWTDEQQNGGLPFQTRKYNKVYIEIGAQIPIWDPMLKQWTVGSFFLVKILQKSSHGPTKIHLFHKNK